MRAPVRTIIFDIIETVFSLEPMRSRFIAVGLPGHTLERWFAAGLRDAFALAVTGDFSPFRSVLECQLEELFVKQGLKHSSLDLDYILNGMRELPPQPDAEEAINLLFQAGFRLVALSNGARSATAHLLQGAKLDHLFASILSVEDVKLSKPREEVYRYAVGQLRVTAEDATLVAAHAWDTHGAKCAGLTTVFISRGLPYPEVMRSPDIFANQLLDAAQALTDLDRKAATPRNIR